MRNGEGTSEYCILNPAGFNMQYSDVPSPFLMTAKQVAEQGVKACLKGKEIFVVRGGF